MAKAAKKRMSSVFDEDLDVEDLGVETEAEKHMKVLLQKQLNTSLSIKEQFAQHRVFSRPSTYKSLTELIKGTSTLENFKEIERDQEVYQELQRCGLTQQEITDYLAFKSGKKKGNCTVNPSIWNENMVRIEEKIELHNEDLQRPQLFSNVKKLTRHEMDIEKTLYAGCADKSKLSSLLSITDSHTSESDAFNYVKTLSKKLLENCKKRKKKKKLHESEKSVSACSEAEPVDFQFDSNIHHVTVPLEENEVAEKRLSIEEIKKLPKFENYKMGNLNKVLYLKNLHPKATVHELRSIFGLFEEENMCPIDYKLCTGRMKGQAFVTFSSCKTAEKALLYANGYVLRGKPIIIEFGRSS